MERSTKLRAILKDRKPNMGFQSQQKKLSEEEQAFIVGSTQLAQVQALHEGLNYSDENTVLNSLAGGHSGFKSNMLGRPSIATQKIQTVNRAGIAVTLPRNGVTLEDVSNLYVIPSHVKLLIEKLNNVPRYAIAEFFAKHPP